MSIDEIEPEFDGIVQCREPSCVKARDPIDGTWEKYWNIPGYSLYYWSKKVERGYCPEHEKTKGTSL